MLFILVCSENNPPPDNMDPIMDNIELSTLLPIININTQGNIIQNEPKINASMDIYYKPNGNNNSLKDDPYYQSNIGIEYRGSSSFELYDKKSYAIETRNADGSNLNVSLFDMPEENDWVLYGPYGDKTLIRNTLSYHLSRTIGQYASRIQFCELVINDQYQGIYVWMEKIKRDKNRVDIPKLNPDEITGDDLTGGYIVKIDKTDGSKNQGWVSTKGTYYQYHYPDEDDIADEQKEYIRNYFEDFENTIQQNTIQNLDSLINIDSWVDYAIINELAKNIDGYRLSAFMYKFKDSDDKTLHYGPVWDFNIAWGNAYYYDGFDPEGWSVTIDYSQDSYQMPFWWPMIWQHPQFKSRFNQRWQELRQNELSTTSIMQVIDNMVNTLQPSINRNFEKWNILGTNVWPNYYIGNTWEEELNFLKTWIQQRLNFIDNNTNSMDFIIGNIELSTLLPIININTQGNIIQNEPKINASMDIYYKPNGNNNSLKDDPYYQSNIGIEYRGSSSFREYDKKSYAIETRNADGSNLNVSLFDMPEENDWVLYGPYGDKTLIRNTLSYHLSRTIGQYASRIQFCELVINNQYQGIYVWMEKIKRDKNRVDIPKLNPDEITGDDLTGGYIVKIDKTNGSKNQGWTSTKGTYYQYHYPDEDDIADEQKEYIRNYFEDFENTIQQNTIQNLDSLINIDSWVDYTIINELAKNVDAYRLSTFMYKFKDSDDKTLHYGPVWDFNIAWGNAYYFDGFDPEGWSITIDYSQLTYQMPFWWSMIWQHPQFKNRFNQRWQELRQNELSTTSIMQVIDNMVNTLQPSINRNFEKWNILGTNVWPNYYIGNTWEEELNFLKTWIQQRLNFIDNNTNN